MGTFLVNISGCLLIGIFYALSEKGNLLTPEWRLFLTTGFCGGFTTFSSFAYENVNLLRNSDFLYFGLYILSSVVLGIAGVYLGIFLIKSI
jgi:CrcB protein